MNYRRLTRARTKRKHTCIQSTLEKHWRCTLAHTHLMEVDAVPRSFSNRHRINSIQKREFIDYIWINLFWSFFFFNFFFYIDFFFNIMKIFPSFAKLRNNLVLEKHTLMLHPIFIRWTFVVAHMKHLELEVNLSHIHLQFNFNWHVHCSDCTYIWTYLQLNFTRTFTRK